MPMSCVNNHLLNCSWLVIIKKEHNFMDYALFLYKDLNVE